MLEKMREDLLSALQRPETMLALMALDITWIYWLCTI